MSAELSIIAGMAVITAHLTFYAFKFKDMEGMLYKPLSLLMFFMGLCFLDMIMFSILKIAQNASVTYLQAGILNTGILVMVTITSLMAFALVLGIFLMLIFALRDWHKGFRGRAVR